MASALAFEKSPARNEENNNKPATGRLRSILIKKDNKTNLPDLPPEVLLEIVKFIGLGFQVFGHNENHPAPRQKSSNNSSRFEATKLTSNTEWQNKDNRFWTGKNI